MRALLTLAVALVAALAPPADSSQPAAGPLADIYGAGFAPELYDGTGSPAAPQVARRQGNDSNCEFVAASNGIHNIGGDGERAYRVSRALIPQNPRDYHESFYTLLGPDGSDQPFSLDNLGVAPEAFVGVYEALGYDAMMLAAEPGTPDRAFAQYIRDRLAAAPGRAFAHLWITPRPYNPAARTITVDETGEQVALLYPYHEVAALAHPEHPDQLIVLDGLVGQPYALSLDEAARYLAGFNRVILVRRGDGDIRAHQRAQAEAIGQPYAVAPLGGAFLMAARALWGPAYAVWGEPLAAPYRAFDGVNEVVTQPGKYVQYERIGDGPVRLAPLGQALARDLERAGVVPPGTSAARGALSPGFRGWAEAQFGSLETFERAFGPVLVGEFYITRDQMRRDVLRGTPFAPVDASSAQGYSIALTERALLAWDAQHGTFLLPLGSIAYEQHRVLLAEG